ncbi:hypothetical protein KNE206_73050 [Kitasatospora sp. NE20-6]|uniref:ABC transporter substrate-binding protein n=1 Tax=Kitasatospora sp. NE20-6 TaxID=2859066 RepID=UPI0034DBA1E2
MSLTRRALLAGAASGAIGLGYARRSGFTGSTDSGDGRTTLTFATWGSDAELAAFRSLIATFESTRPGVRVRLQIEPYAQMFIDMDAQLQGGRAPDLFRCDYMTLGMYSGNGQLLDLSPYFTTAERAAFLPAFWAAVCHDGRPYAVPHHTDTTAVLYRKDMFEAAGITSVPQRLDDAWTWEEFDEIAGRLKAKLPPNVYPFSYDWQQGGAYRWLTWLFAAGGRLLDDSLTAPAIPSPQARKAMDFTKGFFERGLVPPNSGVKSYGYPDSLFTSGTVAMTFAGDFMLPTIAPALKDEQWGATFQPRDAAAATDLGGNTVVVTRHTEHADLAVEFAKFLATPAAMRTFCEQTVVLPTLGELLDADFSYAVRPDLMGVFFEQATVLTPEMTAQTAVPAFGRINAVLQDELEAAFVGGQSSEATVERIAAGTRKALAG